MPRAALSTGEISAFRDRIREVAARLFAEAGYPAVTLRAIAAEVGCSPMTPYRYFQGKEEIFAVVRAEAFRRFADAQERGIRGIDDPAECLAALGRVYIEFAQRDPESYRHMFELGQAPVSDNVELAIEGERAWRIIHDAVARAVDAGVLDGDPLTLAHVFWASVHGLVSLAVAGKLALGRSLDDLVEPVMSMLLQGTKKRTQRGSRS